MMYSDGFVIAVKFNGKVLRESYQHGNRTVYLPYHSEYSLLLKNNKDVRALAQVEIDGMDVLSGKELVIDANSQTELERFMLDGNLNSGRRLKFVPLSDPAVQDPTSSDNGLIRVKFTEEAQTIHWYYTEPKIHKPGGDNWWKQFKGTDYSKCQSRGVTTFHAALDTPVSTHDCDTGDKGATVEGSHSNQSFGLTDFGTRGNSTTLTLRLLAQKDPVYVSDTRYKFCTSCGKRVKRSAKYCSNCGRLI